MDCPDKISPLGTLVTHHQAHRSCQKIELKAPSGRSGKKGTLDHILDTADIEAPAVMTCTEATHDHSTRTDTTAIEVAGNDLTPHTRETAADPAVTHHSSHTAHITVIQTATLETTAEHIAASQATAFKTIVDQAHDHPTNCQSTGHTKRDCTA